MDSSDAGMLDDENATKTRPTRPLPARDAMGRFVRGTTSLSAKQRGDSDKVVSHPPPRPKGRAGSGKFIFGR